MFQAHLALVLLFMLAMSLFPTRAHAWQEEIVSFEAVEAESKKVTPHFYVGAGDTKAEIDFGGQDTVAPLLSLQMQSDEGYGDDYDQYDGGSINLQAGFRFKVSF